MPSDAYIQVEFTVAYGSSRDESDARALVDRLVKYAERAGVDTSYVEDYDAKDSPVDSPVSGGA